MPVPDIVLEDPANGVFRVHRSAWTSSSIMELEWERIFNRSWLYVGHDSELPDRGDYLRRGVAGRPLIFVRGKDGVIRIFLNSCTHRGAYVCRENSGNTDLFTCFYHGWSFNTCGKLVGIPDPSGYSEKFLCTDHSLVAPPHIESYRGMYFVSFGSQVPSLAEYLGSAREIIDLTMDSAEPLGGWTVINGSGQYDVRANWKLLVENSVDNYHFRTVHRSYTEYQSNRRAQLDVPRPNVNRIDHSRSLAFDNGHVGMETQAVGRTIANPSALWSNGVITEVNRVRDELIERYGETRGRNMSEFSRFLIIFPNVAFQDTQTGFRIRQMWPVAPDRMSVNQWEFVPRGEREDVAACRREGSVTFVGGGGFGTPDDIEALESCQMGFHAREVEWSDMSRGMQREPRSDDELAARGFWRQWHALIQGRSGAERWGDLPAVGAAPAAKRAG